MASDSPSRPANKSTTDTRSTAIQREYYVDVLESLIKSFPGPREDAIREAIKYLQDVDNSSQVDVSINREGRDGAFAIPTQNNSVGNEKNNFGRGSAEVELSQTKKSYSPRSNRARPGRAGKFQCEACRKARRGGECVTDPDDPSGRCTQCRRRNKPCGPKTWGKERMTQMEKEKRFRSLQALSVDTHGGEETSALWRDSRNRPEDSTPSRQYGTDPAITLVTEDSVLDSDSRNRFPRLNDVAPPHPLQQHRAPPVSLQTERNGLETGIILGSFSSTEKGVPGSADATTKLMESAPRNADGREYRDTTMPAIPSAAEAASLAADTAQLLSEKFPSISPSTINSAVYTSILKAFENKDVEVPKPNPWSRPRASGSTLESLDEVFAAQTPIADEANSQSNMFFGVQFPPHLHTNDSVNDTHNVEPLFVSAGNPSEYDYQELAHLYYDSMMQFSFPAETDAS